MEILDNEVINDKAQRLELVREQLGINKSELARRIGSPQSHISKVLKGEVALGDLLGDKIVRRLHINPVWWESGEGAMLLGAQADELTTPAAIYQGMISGEKAKLYLSELPDKEAEMYVPYYDVEITAGRIEIYFDDELEDPTPEGYVYAPQYRGCIMCNVKGDSMYDKIFPGARLYVNYMPDKKYIDFGQIFLIVLPGERLLKYIFPHPSDETKVILKSHNDGKYPAWPIEKADILHLFKVKGFENQNAM